jgi:protein-disulfide isomerase
MNSNPWRWKGHVSADALATSLMIVASTTLILRSVVGGAAHVSPRPSAPPSAVMVPKEPVPIGAADVEGAANSPAVLIEFSDFECPYCGRFARETLPEIREKYIEPGRLLLAFRHLPLEARHPHARSASEAAICAGEENKFSPMHNVLFEDQLHLDDGSLRNRASKIGLDPERLERCMKQSAPSRLSEDKSIATDLGVTVTPTFLVGWRQIDGRVKVHARLVGALPFAKFAKVIDDLLAVQPETR